MLINGDPGKGCSSDLLRQFNTGVFQGAPVNSNGLESGQNYMRGCPDHVWDFAIARNVRLGGNRSFQIRAELFNAFSEVIISDRRNSNAQFAEPAGADAHHEPAVQRRRLGQSGSVEAEQRRIRRATSARALRNVQLQVRFSF